jgi:hypothetical protein
MPMTPASIERRMRQGEVLTRAADALAAGDIAAATTVCRDELVVGADTIRFPLAVVTNAPSSGPVVPRASVAERLRIAYRDGFVDRYSPERWRLVNPGATRVINLRVGDGALPTRMSAGTVRAYAGNAPVWWDCWPTVDHRVPWSRGGGGGDDNLLCTSWWRNDSKRALSAEETGWTVHPHDAVEVWDGLSGWFLRAVAADPGLLADPMVRSYHDATTRAVSTSRGDWTAV